MDDAHVAVRQWLNPIIEVGVALSPPKPSPDTVTLQPAVDAPFISLAKLTTGAWAQDAAQHEKATLKQLVRWKTVKAKSRRAAAYNAGHRNEKIMADSLAAAKHADHR